MIELAIRDNVRFVHPAPHSGHAVAKDTEHSSAVRGTRNGRQPCGSLAETLRIMFVIAPFESLISGCHFR
ncbi:MAG: hypothetical protein C0467_32650 [Planctomycetaceae bacterium]|nr:hypothetical protein [Planctomycetaceae bacterium]